jgi:uncharacterized membrane-anchored protein YitT (DUF2179 family)
LRSGPGTGDHVALVTTPAPDASAPPTSGRHSLVEDVLAILTAAAFVSLGSGLLAHARLLTGGTFGVALLLTRFTPLTFGQLYTLLNLPFFWLGVRQMGWRFTLKTFAAIGLVSLGADALGRVIRFAELQPAYAAVMGGLLVGVGLLILFRHQASLGGLNILAIWLQERRVVRAGAFQMAVDSLIVVASFFVVTPLALALSVLGAVAMNLVLAVNHRPGRYLGA